jgi:hypothetical protein
MKPACTDAKAPAQKRAFLLLPFGRGFAAYNRN